MQRPALRAGAEPARVCEAQHRSSGVRVAVPGDRGAEGREKGVGIAARLLPIPIRSTTEDPCLLRG